MVSDLSESLRNAFWVALATMLQFLSFVVAIYAFVIIHGRW